MPSDATGRRGSYAKGIAKREEILTRALDVVAREGYRGASVKELADAVGLSQAGLLHYFGSKEELFTEILRKRDEVDAAHYISDGSLPGALDVLPTYLQLVRHNADVPGLVQLFSRLAVDAADPDHAAHAYFLERSAQLRGNFAPVLAELQAAGRMTDRIDAETLARIVQAVADGLQLQWMQDPSVDMATTIEALFAALTPASGPTPGNAPENGAADGAAS